MDNNEEYIVHRFALMFAVFLIHIFFEDMSEEDNDDDVDGDEDSDDDFDFGFDSSSDDDENNVNERRVVQKIENYVENIVPLYDKKQFRCHFRLKRRYAYQLIERYRHTHYLNNNEPLPGAITHEKAFLLTLWYLANTEGFRQISDRFNLTMSSAHRVLLVTLDFIISLTDEYIRWPNRQEKEEISRGFYDIQNIPGVIGAIDGCHIRIQRPMTHQRDYYNRKKYHSIVLQGTVNSGKMFTDVHIGEPGSMHDARVLRRSPLYQTVYEDRNFLDGFCLLGDSAYPSSPWLVPPFRDDGLLTEEQREFNFKHSFTRILIEHAFGLLKGRFRRLSCFKNLLLHIINKCVMAACVLHNICNLAKIDESDSEADDSDEEYYYSDEDPGFEDSDGDDERHLAMADVVDRRQHIFDEMFL